MFIYTIGDVIAGLLAVIGIIGLIVVFLSSLVKQTGERIMDKLSRRTEDKNDDTDCAWK